MIISFKCIEKENEEIKKKKYENFEIGLKTESKTKVKKTNKCFIFLIR